MNKLLSRAWGKIVARRMLLIPAGVILLQVVAVQWWWPKPSQGPTVQDVERLLSTAALDQPLQLPPGPALPAFPLAECLAINPFEAPAVVLSELPDSEPRADHSILPFAEPEPPMTDAPVIEEPVPRRAAALQKRVEAIYRTSRGAVALVDSQPVRAGDVIDGAFQVIAIRLDGLVLEPLAPASPPPGADTLTEGPAQERR